eukprot:TRINITY_DN28161_c0_g1_i1.p3 TRINITY_DN28161_c0_g1~~TRINITY_DN28161_c0_g1_i1.p3  ORF type:complete len:172 (+),score=64.06 TRINITY_DN28161_c0_g1_i1:75-518(+)
MAGEAPTLRASVGGAAVFESSSKWLHPIFELDEWLYPGGLGGGAPPRCPPAELHVRDKVIGRAAALLLLRLGVRQLHAETLSALGREALEAAGAVATWDAEIPSVGCATEQLLGAVTDPHEAHRIVAERRRLALARAAASAAAAGAS